MRRKTENAGDTSTANGKNLRGARLNAMKFKRMEITLNVVEGVVFTKRRKTTFPKYIQKMAVEITDANFDGNVIAWCFKKIRF